MIPSQYKMLPLEKSKDAYTIKLAPRKPLMGKTRKRSYFRILKMSKDKNQATICGDMIKLDEGGQLSVLDVDISRFMGTAWVGDIIAYEDNDAHFQNPVITHRVGQRHQHPVYLVAPEEK
jgi:hypothetical protein